jgi:uncharacterized repeat protein (TIGR03843 family)
VSGDQRSSTRLTGGEEGAPSGTLELLAGGDVEVLGLLPYSSNYTMLAKLSSRGAEALAVYKPRRGERPLWDFTPGSLAAREVAAYLVSEAAGWGIVPPTVLRGDAPLGEGSLQLFVPHDPERHCFVIMEERMEELACFAAFDVVANNADRKAGHVLEGAGGKLWGVDHGLTFHVEPKLRTVIWAFADQPLSPDLIASLERLEARLSGDSGLGAELAALLSPVEAGATRARLRALLKEGRFPPPGDDRPLPWPLV